METNLTQNEKGEWVEATPLDYCCEYGEAKKNGHCDSNIGEWYHRNENDCDGSSWDEEPIFLCRKHGIGHIKYKEIL